MMDSEVTLNVKNHANYVVVVWKSASSHYEALLTGYHLGNR